MTTSNTVTKTDLTNILNEVLPIRSDTPLTEITLPYTPQTNGILFGQLRATAAGRAYKHLYNAIPDLWDFYQSAGGYQTFASFVVAGQQISERAISNIQQQFYYFVPLDGYGIAGKGIDYIVEQGTSGIWTYRKWNSGNIELWGRYSATLSNYTTAFNGYGYYTTISLPFTVYTPVINYSVQIGSGFAIPGSALGYAGSASLSSFNVYAIANVSGSQSTVWVCDVKGKWK